jgi:hypothetical protein
MAGPLTDVDTLLAAINFDVNRQLRWGQNIVLEFIVPDRSQTGNWRILETVNSGFDRVTANEKTQGDGSDAVYKVADTSGTLRTVLRQTNLHIRVDGEIYPVASVPQVAANKAQVFTLICKTRTLRTNFDATR